MSALSRAGRCQDTSNHACANRIRTRASSFDGFALIHWTTDASRSNAGGSRAAAQLPTVLDYDNFSGDPSVYDDVRLLAARRGVKVLAVTDKRT